MPLFFVFGTRCSTTALRQLAGAEGDAMPIQEFKSGDRICARIDLPLREPHLDFGPCVHRGASGQFMYYGEKRDGVRLAVVVFENPKWKASSLLYAAFPAQINKC